MTSNLQPLVTEWNSVWRNKRSLIYLIPSFRSGSATGADRSQVSPNNTVPAVSSYIDILRKLGRRFTASLGLAIPEGKQVTGETVASRCTRHTGPRLWGNWIKSKENGKNPMYLEKSLDGEKAEWLWQVLEVAFLQQPIHGWDICSCPHLSCSQYHPSYLLLPITYKTQTQNKSFTWTLWQTIFLEEEGEGEQPSVIHLKAKTKVRR